MKRKFGIAISILCFFLSVIILFLSLNYNKNNALLKYDIENDASYKVYLINNTFYDKPYLTEQSNIPTGYIDYITVTLNNKITFDKSINTKYTYNIKAIVEVIDLNKSADNVVYEKEYILLEDTTVSNNSISNTINKSVDIDYKQYNELVNKYKLDLKMPVDANVKVILNVKYNNSLIKDKENVIVNIPLSVNTINITKDFEPTHHEELIKEINNKKIFIIMGISLFALSVITLLYSLNNVFDSKEDYKNYKLNKILSYYETLIVEVDEVFSQNNKEIIAINNFKDMVDLNMQLHLPILYYKQDNIFIINDNNSVYLYKLNDNYEKI